ncbi:MAG: DUF3999 family protein [Acidobacteria bacterium]|nr:MAG: DUF3999 family protein [Acidobacteriota bacterium]
MSRRHAVIVCAALAWGAPAVAAAPELRALFPLQAPIVAPSGQLVRLVLPPEVLAACRDDLADLRIIDHRGREVPYRVDAGPPPDAAREVRATFAPAPLSASREEVAREGAANLLRERYELPLPDSPPAGEAWQLVMASRRPAFVRRVAVEAGGEVIARGSFFRLREPRRERLRLDLPELVGDRVTVILEGEEGFFLEPELRFESARTLAAAERAEVELKEASRSTEAGRTRLELERPRGVVPDLLHFATTTAAFHRRIAAWDDGPGAMPGVLGRGEIFRLPAIAPVEELEIAVGRPRGDRLRVEIDDGDSPPLEGLRVRAVVRRPALIFALPDGAGEATATLAFGGGRAYRPRYDLAGLPAADRRHGGDRAEVAGRLYDPSLTGSARLGEIAPNPHFDPAPLLAFAHRPGSVLDVRRYRYRRELTVEPSAEGLARLTLGLEDLARARADLADLRLVDAEGRQWAYLLERDAAQEVRQLKVPSPEVDDGASIYRPELPATPATLSRLALEVAAPFFDRDFELRGRRDDEAVVLARGRLVRRIGDPRPASIDCPGLRIEGLELRVADGDDAPLAIDRARAHFPLPVLYLPVPAGHYALLLGDGEARAPRYELERVRRLILAVASNEVEASALTDNPAYSAGARFLAGSGRQQLLLWLALGLAVLVLTVLTLRLARH